jgi:hypothetical protein
LIFPSTITAAANAGTFPAARNGSNNSFKFTNPGPSFTAAPLAPGAVIPAFVKTLSAPDNDVPAANIAAVAKNSRRPTLPLKAFIFVSPKLPHPPQLSSRE